MVTTRAHPSGEEQKLGEEKLQPEKMPEGPISKKPKTKPLQQADRELEEDLEQQVSKEKKELGTEGLEGEEEEEGGEEEEEGPTGKMPEEEGEEEEEVEEGEEGATAGRGTKKGTEKGGRGGGKVTKSVQGLQVGEPAPEFSLPNEEGQMISLKDFKGQYVALYFFNKSMTPIITKGGMAFAKVFPEMEKMGMPLLFIGPDSVDMLKKFKGKAKLPFPLLSDSKKEVARAYHNLRGRNVARTTVLVDPEGKILNIMADLPESEVEKNPFEALEFMKQELGQKA